MNTQPVTQTTLCLRSFVPGRERWEIDALLGRPSLSDYIEGTLLESDEILSAKGNPVTGRLLVLYNPETAPQRIAELIHSAVTSALPMAQVDRRERPKESALTMSYKGSKSGARPKWSAKSWSSPG